MVALVIDDCSVTRTVLAHVLGKLGYEVAQAANGREGLELLRLLPRPRIVFVDWSMPELDGLGFIRAVRTQTEFEDLPILMATTETELGQVAAALDAGASEYIMKPFTKEMIVDKLAILGVEPD